jgi:hypothetical protein
MAYVGPGADVAFISYALTLLWWALAAFLSVLLWPAYALVRWVRRRKTKPAPTSSSEPAPEEDRVVSHTDS